MVWLKTALFDENQGVEEIGTNEGYHIFQLTSPDACKIFGTLSRTCLKMERIFNQYSAQGPIYILTQGTEDIDYIIHKARSSSMWTVTDNYDNVLEGEEKNKIINIVTTVVPELSSASKWLIKSNFTGSTIYNEIDYNLFVYEILGLKDPLTDDQIVTLGELEDQKLYDDINTAYRSWYDRVKSQIGA